MNDSSMNKYSKNTYFITAALMCFLVGCGEGEIITQENESLECEASKPGESCLCEEGKWVCETPKNCAEDCDGTCVDGVCQHKDESDDPKACSENCDGTCVDGVCQKGEEDIEDEVCPESCPNDCTKGVCNHTSMTCPESCPDDCTDGKCNSDETVSCPDECPNDCIDGQCFSSQKTCPESCPDACDELGNCESVCPEACPETCDPNGVCPPTCPESCTTSCDAAGICQCAPACKTQCDENGVCQCPDSCKTSCDENGLCRCPESCQSGCDENGVCQCPSTCKTNCDGNGICQCPSKCPNQCDANGVCPAMCGNEVIQSFKFGSKELDVLVPSFKDRTSSYSTLLIKTDKNSYDLSTAPCKDKIKLKSSNTKVMTVSKNVGCKFTSVGAGVATCTATLDGTDLSATLKVHVLNPNHFNDNMAEKKDGNYIHVYSGILQLAVPTRVSQGFDFYNNEYMYFSQLKYNQKLTNGTTLKRNGAVIFQNKPQNNNSKPMTVVASGHAQNLSIERTGGKDYVWVGNYGSLVSGSEDDGYKYSQTLSRIEYQPGKTFFPQEVEEHYAHSDTSSYYYNFEPALDQKNNKFALKSLYKGDGLAHIKIYNFSKVKALTPKTVKLKKPIMTVEKSGDAYKIVNNKVYSITAKDLASLTPTNEFSIKASQFPSQGWEIENGIIYTVIGLPESKVSGKYLYQSQIMLKLFTYNGKELGTYYLRTSSENNHYLVNKDLDGVLAHTADGIDYYNVGYFEPEGIRVSDGKAYISVTTHLGYKKDGEAYDTPRRQMIFVYDLMK